MRGQLRSRDPRALARDVPLHRRRARLQAGLGRIQVQGEIRQLPAVGQHAGADSTDARGQELGALAHDRLRQVSGGGMSRSVWKNNANGRTVQPKEPKGAPFVMLQKWMLASPAWQSLSSKAIAAYIELARRYNGMNNGQLHLSVRELGTRLTCSKKTAARAIRELMDKGF